MKIINVTMHALNVQKADGSVYIVEPCGTVINAVIKEEHAFSKNGVEFVRTTFVTDAENEQALERLERENPDAVIVGSIIAAQAFPGRVYGIVYARGFERAPITEKRMRDDKFVTFA